MVNTIKVFVAMTGFMFVAVGTKIDDRMLVVAGIVTIVGVLLSDILYKR